jgi:two-component system, NarL family, nitrate/nitrite response regulator NarL
MNSVSQHAVPDNVSTPIRILIVDDHLVVRAGLHMLIENHPGMRVVAMASNRGEALELAGRHSPNLILLDLDLGGESALTFLPQLRDAAPDARILVLTGLRDSDAHRQAVQSGAMGVVLKEHAPDVLIKAIEKVHEGEFWLDRPTMGRLLREMSAREVKEDDPELAKIHSLTQRERDVVALIAEGLKNRQIGERLFISETTVTHHLSSVYAKLGVSDRLELVIYAFSHKIAAKH